MVHAAFSDIGSTYDIDHPIVNLISSISVDITGTLNYPYTECPSVTVTGINIDGDSVTFTVDISADILKELKSSSVDISGSIKGTDESSLEYTDDNIHIVILTSGISAPDGDYNTSFVVRLNNITIHPTRKVELIPNEGADDSSNGCLNRLSINSGYNVSVTISNDTLNILGSPGAGIGKYFEGGMDTLYSGLRSINGLRLGNNINIEMSDVLISDGGYV